MIVKAGPIPRPGFQTSRFLGALRGPTVKRYMGAILALLIAEPAWLPTASGDALFVPGIDPINLGIFPNCYDSQGYTLNNQSYPGSLVIAGAANCNGQEYGYVPFKWQYGAWSRVQLPQEEGIFGGFITGVSDQPAADPILVLPVMYNMRNIAWVKMPGQLPTLMPIMPNMVGRAADMAVSAQGTCIVGGNTGDAAGSRRAVRWQRENDGWSTPEDIGPGVATATDDACNTVIGISNDRSWIWRAGPGGGDLVLLDENAQANAVTHDGSLVVGRRTSGLYPIPVYWAQKTGQWRMHDLEALDNVDSEAMDVALVDGQAIIVGWGYSNQDGGILRAVAWIPAAGGEYSAPIILSPLGGAFESWADAKAINRHGIVLGTSDLSATDWTPVAVIWRLFEEPVFQINPGLNDAWYDAGNPGQGLFIIVFPDAGIVFLAWFTYDTERPPEDMVAFLGEAGHRWVTAQGPYNGDTANLDVYLTEGGVFDSEEPAPVTGDPIGSITIVWHDCEHGTLTYDIDPPGVVGQIEITRIVPDNVALCEALSQQ